MYYTLYMKTLIFGGAFDPPHREHLNILLEASKAANFDRVVIVPTFNPPHKDDSVIDFDTRVLLIDKLFKKSGINYIVDDIEKRRGDSNYAVEVVAALKEKYAGELYYLIGGDSLINIETWHKPELLFPLATLVVCGREGYVGLGQKIDYLQNKYGAKIIKINYIGSEISSSLLRLRLNLKLDADVDGIELIKDRFNKYDSVLNQLKSYQSDDLYFHSRAVAYRAVEIARHHRLNIDLNKAFLAGLLHDNAKQRLSLDGFDVPSDAVGSPVLHQFLGSLKAERDFGIEDIDILSAINYHTTGKADMTTLEKLIYCADMLSEDRPCIENLLKVIMTDFEIGFRSCLASSYFYVLSKKRGMYPLTQQAFDYYIKNAKFPL